MKKFFLIILIILSFSLTSCEEVKLVDYENQVENEEFKSKYHEQYDKLINKIEANDFIYKDNYNYYTTNESKDDNPFIKTKSTFKQDWDNNIAQFTENGSKKDVFTEYKEVKVNTFVTHFVEDDKNYIKDKNGETDEYHIGFDILYKNRCKLLFVEEIMSYDSLFYSCYIDDNRYTVVFSGTLYGMMDVIQIKQVTFEENKFTFYMQELTKDDDFTTVLNLSMVITFEEVELSL